MTENSGHEQIKYTTAVVRHKWLLNTNIDKHLYRLSVYKTHYVCLSIYNSKQYINTIC